MCSCSSNLLFCLTAAPCLSSELFHCLCQSTSFSFSPCLLIDETAVWLTAQFEEIQCCVLYRDNKKSHKLSHHETSPVLPCRRWGACQSRGGASRRSGGHWSERFWPLHTIHNERVSRDGGKWNGLCRQVWEWRVTNHKTSNTTVPWYQNTLWGNKYKNGHFWST